MSSFFKLFKLFKLFFLLVLLLLPAITFSEDPPCEHTGFVLPSNRECRDCVKEQYAQPGSSIECFEDYYDEDSPTCESECEGVDMESSESDAECDACLDEAVDECFDQQQEEIECCGPNPGPNCNYPTSGSPDNGQTAAAF